MCGLSRKQIWRRQAVQIPKFISEDDASKNHPCASSVEATETVVDDSKAVATVECAIPVVEADIVPAVVPCETAAAPVAAVPEPVVAKPVAASPVSSVSKCSGPVAKIARKKKVEFFPNVTVVLIPSLTEYRQADLCRSLYWSPNDLRQFHINLTVALQKYMTKCAYSDKRMALKKMMSDPECEMDDPRLVF